MLLGEASSIQVAYPNLSGSEYSSQVVSALLAAALLLLAVAAARYTRILEWFSRRTDYVIAAFGLFWWLFLWPSAAGWLIVLAAMLPPYVVSLVHRRTRRHARVS
jgi:hypothetical protein